VRDPRAMPAFSNRNPQLNYWFASLPMRGAVYVRYNRCTEIDTMPFAKFSEQVLAALEDPKIQRLIIDLRGNSGGNSAILEPLIERLRKHPKATRPGGLVAMIGNRTFSSALMNAISLKERAGAVLVGAPSGGKPNSYGEVMSFHLTHSGLPITYSTKFFKVMESDPPTLEPDVRSEIPWADFKAGLDPVLDAALDYKAR
jgi:C-terminal processing protease CtpA/Prc